MSLCSSLSWESLGGVEKVSRGKCRKTLSQAMRWVNKDKENAEEARVFNALGVWKNEKKPTPYGAWYRAYYREAVPSRTCDLSSFTSSADVGKDVGIKHFSDYPKLGKDGYPNSGPNTNQNLPVSKRGNEGLGNGWRHVCGKRISRDKVIDKMKADVKMARAEKKAYEREKEMRALRALGVDLHAVKHMATVVIRQTLQKSTAGIKDSVMQRKRKLVSETVSVSPMGSSPAPVDSGVRDSYLEGKKYENESKYKSKGVSFAPAQAHGDETNSVESVARE